MIDNSKRAVLEDRVQHIDLEGISTVRDLMNAYMDSSIQSRALANCARVYESALRDPERPSSSWGSLALSSRPGYEK